MNKSFFVKLLLVLLFVVTPSFVSADTGNMNGWAWSDTIGWISFTSRNDHDPLVAGIQPNPTEYGVTENADGTLTGYAWSEHVGWIKFGGLNSFPSGAGTYAQNAKLEPTGELRGWIRVCSGTVNGDCVSASRTDGWDGWISLWGTGYGVTKSAAEYRGFAWGDVNLGWVLFDIQNQYGINPPPPLGPCVGTCGVIGGGKLLDFDVKDGSVLGASLSGNTNVAVGTTPWFVWTIQNAPAVTCDITNPVKPVAAPPFTPITGLVSSGNQAGNPLNVTGAYTYRIDCSDGYTKSVTFTVASAVVPGFTLGGNQIVRIQFPGPGPADSEIKQIPINAFGNFTNPVTLSIVGVNNLPAGVTFSYSLGGGAFGSNPTAVSNWNGANYPSVSFQVRSSARFVKSVPPVIVTVKGSGGGIDAYVDMRIDPSGTPVYIEF